MVQSKFSTVRHLEIIGLEHLQHQFLESKFWGPHAPAKGIARIKLTGADVNDSVRKIRMEPGKKTLIQRLLIAVSITAKHAPEPRWDGESC